MKLATVVEVDPKSPFSIATTTRCMGGRYAFLWITPLTLNPYLIMLSVKQGGFKYHFLSLWYDSTCDLTPVSRAIGEHYHSNYSIIENGQNTEKSSGDLLSLKLQ